MGLGSYRFGCGGKTFMYAITCNLNNFLLFATKHRQCDKIMTFLLYKSLNYSNVFSVSTYSSCFSFLSILYGFFCFCAHFHFTRRNIRMRTELWALTTWCDIWFKCAILYSRMEKWFYRSGSNALGTVFSSLA